MTLATIRDGLQTRLETISGLRVFSERPDQVHPPVAVIRRVAGPSKDTFSGRGHHNFEITVMVGGADLERAQVALDLYTDLSGDSSIRAALEAGNTLGGVAEYISVGDWDMDTESNYNDVGYMIARLPVEVAVTY